MKKSTIIKLTTFAVLIGILVYWIQSSREPRYEGKPLSYWLDHDLDNGDGFAFYFGDDISNRKGTIAIRAIGAQGIPTLEGTLTAKAGFFENIYREFYSTLHAKFDWLPERSADVWTPRGRAEYGFRILGTNALSASPFLMKILNNSTNFEDQDPAIVALQFIHYTNADFIDFLRQRLKEIGKQSTPSSDAYGILRTLAQIGPSAKAVLPEIANIESSTNSLRQWAEAAKISISGEGLEPILISLKDTSNMVTWSSACSMVIILRTNAAAAIPLLINDLNSTNEHVQTHSLMAIKYVHSQPELSIPAVVPFLHSTNKEQNLQALSIINVFGNAHLWVSSSEILPFLTNQDSQISRMASNTLRRIYPEAAARVGVDTNY